MSDDYTIVDDGETMTPAEYGYQWIKDCCPIHQWCSGARPVDQGVVDYVTSLVEDVRTNVHGDSESQYDWDEQDLQNLETLLRYSSEYIVKSPSTAVSSRMSSSSESLDVPYSSSNHTSSAAQERSSL